MTARRTPLLTTVLTLLLGLLASLCVLGAAAAPAQARATGAIAGTVTGPSGTPLEGVLVIAYQTGQPAGTWTPRGSTYTAADGSFAVGELATGAYRVGFFDQTTPVRTYAWEYYDSKPSLDAAADIQVVDGQTSGGRDAQLVAMGHITGTVRRTDGVALDNIEVEAVVPRQGGGWTPLGTDVTGGDGTYDIGGLPTGTYRVTFRDAGHAYLGSYVRESYNDKATIEEAEDLTVSEGSVLSGIDAVLERNGILGGTVTNSSGDPIGGIEVQAFSDVEPGPGVVWAEVGPFTETDQLTGGYAMPLPTGSYRLLFLNRPGAPSTYLPEWYADQASLETAQDVAVVNEQTTNLPDVAMTVGGRISGRLTDQAGELVSGMFAVPYKRGVDPGGATTWTRMAPMLQEEAGAWSVRGLTPGTYRIGFENSTFSTGYLPEFYDDVPALTRATDIVVGEEQLVGSRDAVLTATGVITGTVTAPPAYGKGFRVEAWYSPDGGSTWTIAQTYEGQASTDSLSDGSWGLRGLTPGTYRIKFDEDFPGELATEWYDDVPIVDEALDVAVEAGETVELEPAVLEEEPAPPAPQVDNVAPPVISGSALVGSRLTVAPGSWTPTGVTFAYQWLRSGTVIAGATGPTYTLALADRGRTVSARVTGTKSGHESSSATSSPTATVRSRSTTTVTADPGRGKVVLAVTVSSTRIVPTGSVVITLGSRTLASPSLSRGKVTLTLREQRRGARTYTIRYVGNSRVAGSSTSQRVTIR